MKLQSPLNNNGFKISCSSQQCECFKQLCNEYWSSSQVDELTKYIEFGVYTSNIIVTALNGAVAKSIHLL